MASLERKKCSKCGREITVANIQKHERSCNGKVKETLPSEEDGLIPCPYCSKKCNKYGIRNHIWRAHRGGCSTHGQNQYTKAKRLGFPPPTLSAESRAKLGKKGDQNVSRRPEVRKKVSATCLAKAAAGEWHTSLAKKMHYEYKGEDFHGKWEYAYAQYLDREGIEWQRCRKQFVYEFEEKQRHYTPDFYLPKSEAYVEIKGFKTEKDDAKWSQFPATLVVLRFQELKQLVSKYSDLDLLVIG